MFILNWLPGWVLWHGSGQPSNSIQCEWHNGMKNCIRAFVLNDRTICGPPWAVCQLALALTSNSLE